LEFLGRGCERKGEKGKETGFLNVVKYEKKYKRKYKNTLKIW
jgi:hypothetical protein